MGIGEGEMDDALRKQFMITNKGAYDVTTDAKTGKLRVFFKDSAKRDAAEKWAIECRTAGGNHRLPRFPRSTAPLLVFSQRSWKQTRGLASSSQGTLSTERAAKMALSPAVLNGLTEVLRRFQQSAGATTYLYRQPGRKEIYEVRTGEGRKVERGVGGIRLRIPGPNTHSAPNAYAGSRQSVE